MKRYKSVDFSKPLEGLAAQVYPEIRKVYDNELNFEGIIEKYFPAKPIIKDNQRVSEESLIHMLQREFPIDLPLQALCPPKIGKDRFLGFVRFYANRVFFHPIAHYDKRKKTFLKENFIPRFPARGGIFLKNASFEYFSRNLFFIVDFDISQVQKNIDVKTGIQRTDYAYLIDFSNTEIHDISEDCCFITLSPLSGDLDFSKKIYLRMPPHSEKIPLNMEEIPILLSFEKYLYGPLQIKADHYGKYFVDMNLELSKGIAFAYLRTPENSHIFTGLLPDFNVQFNLFYVQGQQRYAVDLLDDKTLLMRLGETFVHSPQDSFQYAQWISAGTFSDNLFTDMDIIKESRKKRLSNALKRFDTNDEYIKLTMQSILHASEEALDDAPFFNKLLNQLRQNKKFIESLELSGKTVAQRSLSINNNSDKNKITELENKITDLENTLNSKNIQEKEFLEKFENCEKERDNFKKKYNLLSDDFAELVSERNNFDLNLKNMEAQLLGIQEELKNAKGELSIILEEKEELANQLKQKSTEHQDISTLPQRIESVLQEAAKNPEKYAFDGAIVSKIVAAAHSWESTSVEKNFDDRAVAVSEVTVSPLSGKELSDYLISSVQKYRQYDETTILNFFILLTQNFLTIFSGPPGVGKTSICEILAYVLGLSTFRSQLTSETRELWPNDAAGSRFLPVSVERGWTSKGDFVGYYNPLSKTFESTDPLRREAFAELDAENALGFSNIPFMILLDEANLSPMEYYWGDFMRICDSRTGTTPSVALGGNAQYVIPNTLRFLATINNDFTTENLSPRLLDRAGIVTFPEIESTLQPADDMPPVQPIAWTSQQEIFGARSTQLQDHQALKDIYAYFDKLGLPVSMRTRNAITNYVSTGSQIFHSTGQKNATAIAIDFAVMQRLLPRINGNGADFCTRLKELHKLLLKHQLSTSATHLDRLIQRGQENMDWYHFF